MIKIDLIGLPSGEVMEVTEFQLHILRKSNLVLRVKRYEGEDINKFCFDDDNYNLVKYTAITSFLS